MYFRKGVIVSSSDIFSWISAKNDDLGKIVGTFEPLLKALTSSFGPLGTPGDAEEILTVCRLLAAAARNLLEWEEEVRFAYVEDRFSDILKTMAGAGGHVLEEIFQVEPSLSKFVDEDVTGYHKVTISITLPDGYVERMKAAYRKAFPGIAED
jgi:hypothetical protein